MFRYVFVLFFLTNTTGAVELRDSKCTLNTRYFLAQAKALAASKKGASLEERTYTVTWHDATYGKVSVGVGGCFHFGLSATATRKSPKAMDEESQRRFASNFVLSVWPKAYAKGVAGALLTGVGERARRDGETLYRFDVQGFDEVVLIIRNRDGRSVVEISAIPAT